jgi:hypothetical protein
LTGDAFGQRTPGEQRALIDRVLAHLDLAAGLAREIHESLTEER